MTLHSSLTLSHIQNVNLMRSNVWHGGRREWLIPEWTNAMAGEAGEAANQAKKLQRAKDGIESRDYNPNTDRFDTYEAQIVGKIGEELADTVMYAVITAGKLGLDLAYLIQQKFNADSEARGLPHRL